MEVHVRQIALTGVIDAVGVRRIVLTVESPTLGTALTSRLRVARRLALAAVERREVAARAPVLPHHTLTVGIHTARSDDLDFLVRRRLVELRMAGLRRVRSLFDPHQPLISPADAGNPKTAILRIHRDGISAEIDPVILGGIDGFIGLRPRLADLTVPVGVEHARTPALGGFGVMSPVPGVDVHPCDGAPDAEVDEVVRTDLVMVGAETRINVRPLPRFRVVNRQLAVALPERIESTELVRLFDAERRLLLGISIPNRNPDASLPVNRHASWIGRALPYVRAPIRGWRRRRIEPRHQRSGFGRRFHDHGPVPDGV